MHLLHVNNTFFAKIIIEDSGENAQTYIPLTHLVGIPKIFSDWSGKKMGSEVVTAQDQWNRPGKENFCSALLLGNKAML